MTFNRLANIQYSRLKNKVLTDPLQEPTIPIIATSFQPITEEDYLVLGEFLDTDILDGELVINTESDRVWVRSNDSIIELNTTTASGFRPLTTNHIWIGESGLAKEYNLGSGFLVGTNSVSVSGMSLTGGNGITIGSASTIDLGGDLTGDVIINGLGGSHSMYLGNYGPNTQLNYFSVGVNNGMAFYSYDNNLISSGINLGTNVVSIGSNVQNGNVYITGNTAMVSGYDNRRFSLYLYGSGIPTGSGEYFVINGITFSEGLDFTGQGDPVLDAASIAGLTYSGVTDFISLDYTIGSDSIFFNFSNPAVVSASFSSTALVQNQFNTQLSLNTAGAMLVSGNNGLVINNVGEHKFNDTEPNPKGLQYGGNYDATLVDDSLVPKRYVDDSISTISLTGGSGITIGASGSIDLGGTLNQPTILLGNSQTFDLGTTASPLSFLRIEGIQSTENYKFSGEGLSLIKNPGTYFSDMDYTASLDTRSFIQQTTNIISSVVNTNSTYEQTQITQSPNQVDILVRVNGADDSGFVLNQLTDNFSFIDKRLTPRGLEYQDDYSANFSIRSLVDKEYVDNNISGLSFSLVDDLTPQLGGNLDLNNFNIGGTGSIDIEGNVIADMIQLKGGVGTQGEMSWNVDEETIQLVMDGVTQHIGQDTYIHARNNTASTILKGTPVRATGTLGASGRITIAPMIADGSVESRFYIGIAAEDITNGTDGQVMSFGKIRQINLTNFNDGDVLWLDPTIAGLTSSIPQAPDLKVATAFVIHAASNGTLFVRAEQGTDLHNDQRVEVSGLTAGQFLGWDVVNQRWENKTPSGSSLYTANGTIGSGRVATLTDTLSFTGGRVEFNTTTDGILLPRLTTAEMNAIPSPATNLLIINTTLNGLYRYNGSAWVALSAGYGVIEVRDSSGYPTFYADLQTAINATGDIDIIYIHSDIQVTAQISVPYKSSLTIQMNGHRIWYDTTSGDFNLFRFASAPTSGVDRVFILEGGGTLEQVGSVVSTTNAAVIHFFYTGTQRQLQIITGTTNIKTENAFLIFNQNHLRLIDGGFWYSTNGTISINTSTSLIKNASIDIYAQASALTTYIDNCHLNTRWGAFWITGGIVNSRISGAVLQTGSNIGMIMCSGNDIIANNVIENGTGAVNWAINCYYAGSSGRISNNTIYSANAGVYLRYGSASNNYIYSATSRAITKTSLGAGYAIGNVCITNATNVEAIYTTGGAGIINNYCISLNATNTAAAFKTDGASENIFGNTFIVNNASAANVNLAGNVYLAKNIMGNVGTGITGAGVNLMTNTMDAFGNIKIG